MKKIKCLSMVILALGFFAFSANAQNVKEVRKQGLAKKMKTHKTIEAAPASSQQIKAAGTAELKLKPSSKNVELKPRPNAKKELIRLKPVTVQKKASRKALEERPARDFKVDQQKRAAKLSERMSNREFDKKVLKQKIKKLESNQ